jgi:glycerol-3-phosphate dehydrogenase (NAD(P)+)
MAKAEDKRLDAIATIGVAGAGAWGIALANVAAVAGRRVVLWGRDSEAMREFARSRQSKRLPGAFLAPDILVSDDIGALARCEAALVVVPAQSTRLVAEHLARILPSGVPLVACAKGIELGSDLFMTEVLAQAAPGRPGAILSGPSFASDVAAGLPTAVTLACADDRRARALALALNGPNFRLYHSDDVRGVEIGGAAKNVLAIACGIASGLGLGPSAGAALIARGFAELSRFGRAFGARPQTLMGLSGLGDLVLTCTSPQSRNFAFGVALGRGKSAAEAADGQLAEGATTARALLEMARARGVEMPIAESAAAVIAGEQDVRAVVGKLLARPARAES